MLKKILVIIVVLIIVVLVGLYMYRNALVQAAVVESGDYALGVPTELGSTSLNIGGGSLTLKNYAIRNPEGFKGKDFLVLKLGVLDVQGGSLLDNEVVVDSLVLEGFRLSLEQVDGKGNYRSILDNLKKFDMSSSDKSDKRLKVKKLMLRDIGVEASLTLMGKEQVDKSFTIDDITLENVGGTDGTSVGGLIKTVVSSVLSKATSDGNIMGGFDVQGKVDSLKEEGKEKLEDAAKDQLKKIGL